jgi:hypothetical protein
VVINSALEGMRIKKMGKSSITRGIRYGIVGGLVATIVTDLASLIIFLILGESLPDFYALFGQSFLTLFHLQADYPLWQGLTLHYSIGILTGLGVGILIQRIILLEFNTYRRSIFISVIITQIEGLTLFYLMSLILHMPQSEMLLIYGMGIFLHTLWGTCLGTILGFGQRCKESIPVSK